MTSQAFDPPIRRAGTIGALLLRAFQRYADSDMVVGDGERLSFREMAERTARVMGALAGLGLGRGSSLALLSRNRIDVMAVWFAAYLLGIRNTPLSALTSESDLAFILADAEIDALMVDDRLFAARGLALRERTPTLKLLLSLGPVDGAIDIAAAAARAMPAPLRDAASPDDTVVVGYTGGTTGRPKGVVHSHATLLASVLLMSAEWEWPDPLRLLVVTPLSHAAGVLALPTALRGGCLHMLDSFDAAPMLSYMARERITATFLIPVMIYRLVDAARAGSFDLSSLETIFYGAAPMLPSRLAEALAVLGPVFMQLYGQSEAPTCITWLARRQHDVRFPGRLASCGVPFAGVDVALLDESNRRVGDGEVGEVCVRGPHVMVGYWRRPEETAAAFAGGWLHTGDMGRFDAEGLLHIVDRKKDMIISGGINVFPREIEDVIGAIPGVAHCAVVGRGDDRWGESVVAIVVARDGCAIDEATIIAEVRAKKGPVHAPKVVRVVESLPMTILGKVDKKRLRESLFQGSPS